MSRREKSIQGHFSWQEIPKGRASLERVHLDKCLAKTKARMSKHYHSNQVLGRRSTIGCVALEVTQRCNLDCTLCYLSEDSEAVKDIPIEEIYRRIDNIKAHFGVGTDVQITGGDPTLRNSDELVTIVKRIRELGMRPTLMTNGILATRPLLERLVKVGLNDIALHVDITQERKGYPTEFSLNKVRSEYIDRVRGLPIAVVFNTTVCKQNFEEIPELIRFFRKHADVVGMASFQLQADTGRGVLRSRDNVISLETVRNQIRKGAETDLSWETILIGHPKCHKMAVTVEANGNLYDLNDDPKIFNAFLEDFKDIILDRTNPAKVIWDLFKFVIRKPAWIFRSIRFLSRHLWRMKTDLFLSGGRAHKLSFFVQNFMDAKNLDPDRVHACSFMVMTQKGPVSMCAFNANRNEFILRPVETSQGQMWDMKSMHS